MSITRRGFIKTLVGSAVGTYAVAYSGMAVSNTSQTPERKYRLACGGIANVDLKKYYQ